MLNVYTEIEIVFFRILDEAGDVEVRAHTISAMAFICNNTIGVTT
jgi:hypothetical protein